MKWTILFFLLSTNSYSLDLYRRHDEPHIEFRYFYLMFFVDTLFYTKANKSDLKVLVKFQNTKHYPDSHVVGECFLYNKNLIHIENKYWNNSKFYEKKILFYHELGHCLFDKEHKERSIMQSVLLNETIYKQQEYHFIHDFFEN